jgi:tetratricopeptide (TPR) repeat protein
VVFFSPGGEEVQRLEGFRPPDMFLKDVEKVIGASDALAKLKDAAEKSPKDAGAQRAYARALFGGGNRDGAAKVLRAALEAAPEGDEAVRAGILLDLGDAQRSRGDMKGAREAYEKVLATKAEGAKESRDKASAPLANALLALGELDGAVKVLDAYLADTSRQPKEQIEALLLRSFAHARRKDPAKALADLKTVRDADPGGRWAPDATRIIDLLEAK